MLDGQGKEWARLMLEENLRLRAQLEQETAVVGADGVERASVRYSERHLETVLGRVSVPRLAYQAPGTTDLHPLDAALNRMDRTGARWSLTGAEAVLRLRAIRASKDFDAYWAFHLEQERARNHASRYEDGNIPAPLPPPKRRLSRVN